MTWDALTELRLALNDDPHGNLVKRKVVYPRRGMGTDGSVTAFVTFEDRLLTDAGPQSASPTPLRVWYDQAEVAASGVVVTDPIMGEFAVMGAPPSGVVVSASYYYREYLDDELQMGLSQGAKQCNAPDPNGVPDGLQLVCLNVAAAFAHRRAAHRWQQRKVQQFLWEEAPPNAAVDAHVAYHERAADKLMDEADKTRTAYYQTRLGQAQSPAFRYLARQPRPWTPRR